ncbi:hypothetical protein [Neptunicoccus sediminis]|nr:hypothetical protein [Neptunicoccus sediminis]
MNNTVAMTLGLCLVALVVIDIQFNDAEYLILWGRELLRLIDWIAFWR